MLPVRLYTTRIPHHSSHSGYEQLVRFIPERTVFAAARISDRQGWRRQVERVLRRGAVNRWYMWDGIQTEWDALMTDRRAPHLHHFLYGDHTIGWLPRVRHRLRGKLVLTVHACPSDLPEIIQFPKLLSRVDHFILLGGNQEPFFRKWGVPNHRMSIVHHGVDLGFFKPDPQVPKNGSVLMVGNWRRNFPFYRRVIERMPGVPFRVVTAPHNFNWFDGLESQVTLLAGLPDSELLQEYHAASAMLLGAFDAVANNVLLEAMACGLPVVAERVGALPEYTGEQYPLLVDPDDDAAAAACLDGLLRTPAEPDLFVKRAARFSWQEIGRQTLDVYRQVAR